MLRQIVRGLISAFYPKRCLSCGNKIDPEKGEDLVCGICQKEIKRNTPPFCASCGRHLEKNTLYKNICPACVRKKTSFDRAFSPCVYEGVIKKLIHEFKYNQADTLAKPLSKIMIDFIREYRLPLSDLDCIIPVPLHAVRLREREFNQAEELSRPISREFKKELLNDALLRRINTKPQAGLKGRQRETNVKMGFKTKEGVRLGGKNVLLVDDVITTGATASEAALALKDAGANAVFVLTLAN